MTGKNGIAWGWLPDNDQHATSMIKINDQSGRNASTYGTYIKIDDAGSFKREMKDQKNDIVESGAVWVTSLMPTLSGGFKVVDDDICEQLVSNIREYVDSGVEVWVRLGHEMNYYTKNGAEPRYYGSPEDFIEMWQRLYNALTEIDDQDMVSMFWSPNAPGKNEPIESLDKWYSGDDYVDIVGIDVYPSDKNSTFESVYGEFYDRFAEGHDKVSNTNTSKTVGRGLKLLEEFVIGETGSKSYDVGHKQAWVKALANADLSDFPRFKSCSWFEYIKAEDGRPTMDYRLIVG